MSKLKPTFEQAMNAAILWCKAWEEGELSDEVLADRVSELIETKEGARGFFAISLSSDCPLMDRLSDPLLLVLRASGEMIIDLSVKNLAMSTAMAIQHQRDNNIPQQLRSERISARCVDLLRFLEPIKVKKRLERLLSATRFGKGEDVYFIKRWGYDQEQISAISKNIDQIAN